MVKVRFVDHAGTERVVEAEAGTSVMKAAVSAGVPGIDGDCGGECACATCQVYVDEAWRAATGEAGENERGMLEFADAVQANSRLACQIRLGPELDGLLVRTTARQN